MTLGKSKLLWLICLAAISKLRSLSVPVKLHGRRKNRWPWENSLLDFKQLGQKGWEGRSYQQDELFPFHSSAFNPYNITQLDMKVVCCTSTTVTIKIVGQSYQPDNLFPLLFHHFYPYCFQPTDQHGWAIDNTGSLYGGLEANESCVLLH